MKRIVCGTVLALLVMATAGATASAATQGEMLERVASAMDRVQAAGSVSVRLQGHISLGRKRGGIRGSAVQSTTGALVGEARTTTWITEKGPRIRSRSIVIGNDSYTWFPRSAGLDLERPWLHTVTPASESPEDAGTEYRLVAAASGARRIGRDSIHHRSATGYRLTLDYRRIARSGPADVRAMAKELLKLEGDPVVHIEVWIDDAGRLRRMRDRESDGDTRIVITTDLLEFGVPLDGISPPPADQVMEEDAIQVDVPSAAVSRVWR